MRRRLSRVIALWFVVQIVVPFTAPLQTFDLHDLFGGATHHGEQTAPESSTTPTIREHSAGGAVAPLVARLASAVSSSAVAGAVDRSSFASPHRPPRGSSFQHAVLRL